MNRVMTDNLNRIARKYLKVNTLETQHSDSLDYYTLAIWQIKWALQEAYQAGLKAGLQSDTETIQAPPSHGGAFTFGGIERG